MRIYRLQNCKNVLSIAADFPVFTFKIVYLKNIHIYIMHMFKYYLYLPSDWVDQKINTTYRYPSNNSRLLLTSPQTDHSFANNTKEILCHQSKQKNREEEVNTVEKSCGKETISQSRQAKKRGSYFSSSVEKWVETRGSPEKKGRKGRGVMRSSLVSLVHFFD